MNFRVYRRFAACLFLLGAAAGAHAQTIPVPRPTDGAASGTTTAYKMFDETHLKDRPYNFNLPKPQYPSTERVQREFVVEYVYEYALSKYAPEVVLPVVSAVQAKRDTPENLLIAFFSAMRTGDYDAWLACWDPVSQKALVAQAKERKQDAVFWKKLWSSVLTPAKTTTLTDRIETEHYVILDIRLSGPNTNSVPTVMKYAEGQWSVTNELSANPMLYKFNPTLAGVLNLVPPIPVASLDKDNPQQTQTQQRFLDEHTQRDRVVLAGK